MTGPPFIRYAWACLVAWVLPSAVAMGDTWGPPQRDHWSANKKWVLIVGMHGDKTLSLCEKTDDGLQERWRRGYVDSVWPPHRAYVTDDGKYVVLRDVYHNIGYGKVIAILGQEGKIRGSYKLSDLLSQDEISKADRSVSSLWWSNEAWFSFVDSDRRFGLVTRLGTVRAFDLDTGKLLDLNERRWTPIVESVRQRAHRR